MWAGHQSTQQHKVTVHSTVRMQGFRHSIQISLHMHNMPGTVDLYQSIRLPKKYLALTLHAKYMTSTNAPTYWLLPTKPHWTS